MGMILVFLILPGGAVVSTMNLVSKSWRQHMEHFGFVESSLSLRFLKKQPLIFYFPAAAGHNPFLEQEQTYADGSNPILCHMTRSWWTSISTSYLHVTTHTLVGFWSVQTIADPWPRGQPGRCFGAPACPWFSALLLCSQAVWRGTGIYHPNQLQTANAHLRLGITWYKWYNPIFYTNLDHAKTEFMVLSDLILFLDFVLPCLSLHCAIDTLCKLENCKPFVVMCIANDWLLQNLRHAPKSTVMLVVKSRWIEPPMMILGSPLGLGWIHMTPWSQEKFSGAQVGLDACLSCLDRAVRSDDGGVVAWQNQ